MFITIVIKGLSPNHNLNVAYYYHIYSDATAADSPCNFLGYNTKRISTNFYEHMPDRSHSN